MILLEIAEESGITHYEILGITPKDLEGLDDSKIAKKILRASNDAKRTYTLAAKRGDTAAQEKAMRINDALAMLKKRETREQYEKDLQSGKGAALEILRIQPVAPPFFHDRNVRFSIIERLLRDMDGPDIAHYEILGITPKDLEGLDYSQFTKKIRLAANQARHIYTLAAKKGDTAAAEKLAQIAEAESVLRDQKKRTEQKPRVDAGPITVPELTREQVPAHWYDYWLESRELLAKLDPARQQVLARGMTSFANAVTSGNKEKIEKEGERLQDAFLEAQF